MSNKMPSLLALLGLAAVAGYQNRDALSKMAAEASTAPDGSQTWLGDLLGRARTSLKGGDGVGPGATIQAGLSELIERFVKVGDGETAESWVDHGANQPVKPERLRAALGSDLLAQLMARTGLSEVELLDRLSQVLPEAVDKLTPAGRVPSQAEADELVGRY